MATKLLAVQKLGKLFAHFFIRFDEKTKPAPMWAGSAGFRCRLLAKTLTVDRKKIKVR